ncbi:MAG TPA: sigma-E factor negative regulatory protein [Macromonas sp.]|nr:sigma-E factor negative regulatory protein [Macromonas sp.]
MQTTTDTTTTRPLTGVELAARLEQLSAMLDQQATAREIDAVLSAYGDEPELHRAWLLYPQVGEVLREGRQALPLPSNAFSTAVMARLQTESGQLRQTVPAEQPKPARATTESANDPVFRWKLVAGLASFAALAAVLWQVVAPTGGEPAAQWAQWTAPGAVQAAEQSAPAAQAVLTQQGVLIRDPQLQALLDAHRQYGGQSALQMPAGFLRNATYELPQR